MCPRAQNLLNRLHKKQAQALSWSCWIPLAGFAVSLGLAIFCSMGLLHYSIEPSGVGDLWLPTEATILAQRNEFNREFGAMNIERIILTSNTSSDPNIVTEDFFTELYMLHRTITRKLSVSVNGRTYDFDALCLKVSLHNKSGCYQINPLAYWATGPGEFYPPQEIPTTLADTNRTQLNPWTHLDLVVGGITEQTTQQIISAKAVQIWYFLDNSEERHRNPDWGQILSAFENAIIAQVTRGITFAKAYTIVMKSFDEEVAYTIAEDMSVLISFGIMLSIIAVAFLSFDLLYRSKVLVGIMGLVFIGTTASSTIGLATWLGYSVAPMTYYVLFLVIAIGINHVFLVLHAYDRVIERERDAMQDKRTSYRQIAIYVLVEVMPSITVAVVFEILALVSGLLVQFVLDGPIAGLHVFVVTASLGVALDFVLLHGLFVPVLMLDIKRMMAERLDVVPCVRSTQIPKRRERTIRFLVRRYFIRFITLLPVKIVVVVLAVWILSLGIFTTGDYGFTTVDMRRQDSLPPHNYVHEFYSRTDELFKIGTWTNIVLKDIDYTSMSTNSSIADLLSKLRKSKYIDADSVENWYSQYLLYLQRYFSMNASSFYASHGGRRLIDEWLNTVNGLPFSKSIVFGPQGQVEISRFIISEKGIAPEDLTTRIEAMQDVRDVVAEWTTTGHEGYAFSPTYPYLSEFGFLTHASLLHVILALIVALVVGLFVLDIVGALSVVISMVIVLVGLVGITMHYFGYNFTGESVTVLIMTPILCLEFTFHSAVYFLEGTKANDDIPNNTRARRLYWMLVDRGTSVACSILVLLLGALVVLIFATSPVNKNFAALFASAIALIFYHALFVIPVLLSWIGTIYPNLTITGYFLEHTKDSQSDLDISHPLVRSLNWDGDDGTRTATSSAIDIDNIGLGQPPSPSFSSPNVVAILHEEEDTTRTVSRIDYGSLNSAIPEETDYYPSPGW